MVLFTANPEDYTARGKIITPLKDRIGAEIRTHYMEQPRSRRWRSPRRKRGSQREHADRDAALRARDRRGGRVPGARANARSTSDRASASACRSACSRASSRTPSGARSCTASHPSLPRVIDLYAALPSMTGKFELEYEGELKGADFVARELVRGAVSTRVRRLLSGRRRALDRGVVRSRRHAESRRWRAGSRRRVAGARACRGCSSSRRAGIAPDAPAPLLAAGIDFVLEGLYSQKKIGRTDERGYHGTEPVRRPRGTARARRC